MRSALLLLLLLMLMVLVLMVLTVLGLGLGLGLRRVCNPDFTECFAWAALQPRPAPLPA